MGHSLQNATNNKKHDGLPENAAVPKGVPEGSARDEPWDAHRGIDPDDILTPEQLAARLQVSKSWVFEQTRERAKVRSKNPLPCIRLGKYLRFSWSQVCQWVAENNS